MLTLFDLDGTLISSYMDRHDRNYHAWEMLPGRVERFLQARANGFVGIVTNQAGVAFGHVAEVDFRQKIAAVAAQLGYWHVELWDGSRLPEEFSVDEYGARPANPQPGMLSVRVCYADSRAHAARYQQGAERRKPSGAMIREFADEWRNVEIVYVGDRPEDEAAARDAGVAFRWAEEFFS